MKKFLPAFLLFTAAINAQQVNDWYAQSVKAYKHGKYEMYLEYTKKLDSIRPWHPTYTYNLASAYALNQKPEQAIEVLRKVILMNASTAYENEADFASLHSTAGYAQLVTLKSAIDKTVTTSEKVVTLSEKTLHPEGLLYLRKKKQWLAGSIRKGKIVAFDSKSGKCTDWLDTDFSVFALKADADEKYLWVATSAIEEMEGFQNTLAGKGEILKVEIKTRKIINRYTVGGKHIYGDLLVAKNGVVYISDSKNPTVYKIEDDSMMPWFSVEEKIYNLQGMTFNDDETKLYLADYFNGIAEVPVANPGARRWLAFPDETIQKGIDGLAWYGRSLIAIHNGVKPIRIIRYFIDEKGNLSNYKIIDNNRPEFNEPTLPHIVKDKCYFFANCPWPAYNKKRELDESKADNPMLYSFSLKP